MTCGHRQHAHMRRIQQIYSTAISEALSFGHHSGVTDWLATREKRIHAIAKYFVHQKSDHQYRYISIDIITPTKTHWYESYVSKDA